MKRQVFHIITHFDVGGAEKVAFNIAKSNNPIIQYHIVSIVKAKGEFHDGFIKECIDNNIIVHESSIINKKLAIVLFPFWFLLIVLKQRPHVIHSHTEIPDLAIYLWYETFGRLYNDILYFRTIHNTVLWSEWEKIGNVVEKFFKSNNSIIAISKSVQASYYKKYHKFIPVIYNGVETVEQQTFPDIVNNKINVLFAGRIEYQKGIDELISVLEIFGEDERFVFHIVGEGGLKHKLTKVIKSNKILLYDKIYNLPTYLSSFDYLFMPSNFEGFGLMSVEASLAKVPTIINNCPGLNETLPNDWPLAVNDNNVEEYLQIFNNIEIYDKGILGKIAYDFVQHRFNIGNMQEEYESLYLR